MGRVVSLLCATIAIVAAAPAVASAAPPWPDSVALPAGFYPEGIAVGRGHDFYVGSLRDGAIYAGDLRTGAGAVLAPGAPGRVIAGIAFDERSGLLWGVGVGSGAGRAFAFDGATGALVAEVPVPGAFLNDLAITREAIYITDSMAGVLWRLPLDRRGRPAGPATAIALGGDFQFVGSGPLPINLNGIVATPDGRTLIAVHSALGVLYRIDPATGVATLIDLDGGSVAFGDGLVLQGRTLYVVQNFLEQVAVVRLAPDLSEGRIERSITSDLFRVPTTAARFGSSLYLVNARFDAGFPPFLGGQPMMLDYDVVRVRR